MNDSAGFDGCVGARLALFPTAARPYIPRLAGRSRHATEGSAMPRLTGVRKKLLCGVLLLAVVGAAVWWQRTPLLSWYYVRGLADAPETERALWVERVASLDVAAVAPTVALLRQPDARVCANATVALVELVRRWGPADPRTAAISEELTRLFAALSGPGQEAALEWHLGVLGQLDLEKGAGMPVADSAAKLLPAAAQVTEKGVRLRTLALAEILLARTRPAQADLHRRLLLEALAAKDAELRACGIRLAWHAPLQMDDALLDKLVPLLKDGSAEVRRAAVLAVGLAEKVISADDLLPLLHDSDPEVRRLCEAALGGRGLAPNQIKIAKKITDSRPGERLEVVHYLLRMEDLEPGVWLHRLSQDPAPAVRAAAVRFGAEDTSDSGFEERMAQMAREDPSETVRQLAAHYLKAMQRRN